MQLNLNGLVFLKVNVQSKPSNWAGV